MSRSGRSRKKSGNAIATVIIIALLALTFVASLLFFKVNTVEVTGNKSYTSDEIISASQIENGESLIFLSGDAVSSKICSELVCVREVTVRKTFPSKVTLVVSETKPIAVVSGESERYTIDETCRVLRIYDPYTDSGLATVRGLKAGETETGSVIALSDSDAGKTNYLSEILNAVISTGVENRISWIDISSISSIKLLFDSRLTAELGSSENAEYKIGKLSKIAAELDTSAIGTVRLSKDGEAVFSPL